jgi:hypothetical protein
MVSYGKGGELLVEMLDLCEQTLAALKLPDERAQNEPRSEKLHLPGYRHPAKVGQRFKLIIGGMDRSRRTLPTR